MIRIYPYIFSLLACIGIALPGYSQVDRNETLIRSALHGLEYEIKAGFSIGGTAPLPLPVEIRSIDGYNPTLAISIGGEVTKWIAVQNKLGIIVGLRLENKAMTTEATVKNYNMEILGQGGERISGVWTGGVKTKVHTAGLTIPLMATYKLSNRWNIKAAKKYISNAIVDHNIKYLPLMRTIRLVRLIAYYETQEFELIRYESRSITRNLSSPKELR